MADKDHETREGVGVVSGGARTVEEARRLHHLATADPEPERSDGTLTGPAHEEKYGLERAERSAAIWRAAGVHPTENRALEPGDEGYEDSPAAVETADGSASNETTAAPRAKK